MQDLDACQAVGLMHVPVSEGKEMAHSFDRRQLKSGFALLDVMIAVVVMAFGLLALAALQSSLVRAVAESKARSVGISIAKDQLENLRSFPDLAGYQAIKDQAAAAVPGGAIGGVNYTMGWDVRRFALDRATGMFVGGLADTGALNQATYVKDNEFKRIAVTVNWTDVNGGSKSVTLEDAIAALNPQDSARMAKLAGGAGPRKPVVLIKDPGTEDGVIPIAIGDGSETAATNPKPIVLSRTGEQTVETRFDVLTYSALNDGSGNAIAQARVETAVVGCTCTKSAPSPARTGYRPTYWNGYRYTTPEKASSAATSGAKSGATQSPYCNICCQDHNDDGIASSAPKFTPRGDHKHFKPFTVANGWEEAGGGDDYVEACRLIRVDGIFNVAADLSGDYFNLLKTVSMEDGPVAAQPRPPFTAPYAKPNPAKSAQDNYEAFALEYLQKRFVPGVAGTGSGYNDSTGATNGILPGSIATSHDLDDPLDPVEMDKKDGLKWLHARGLYIDYLEPPAVAAVNEARSNCKNSDGSAKTGNALRDCILRVLPFTSINLTELSRWSSTKSGTLAEIEVSNDFFSTSPSIEVPVRGMVTPKNPSDAFNPDGVATVGSSNSGVAVFAYIGPEDQAGEKTDKQAFTFKPGRTEPEGGSFKLVMARDGVAGTFAPLSTMQTGYTYGARSDACTTTDGTFPRTCTTRLSETLPAKITVRFGNYNEPKSKSGVNVCGNTQANKQETMPYIVDYDVTGVSVVRSPASTQPAPAIGSIIVFRENSTGPIGTGEYSEVDLTSVDQDDLITASFGVATYLTPNAVCDKTKFVGWSSDYPNASTTAP